jgi:hypothetical protein
MEKLEGLGLTKATLLVKIAYHTDGVVRNSVYEGTLHNGPIGDR